MQKREPYFEDSSKIWKLCETRQAEGFVSALTFANIVYVMRKELNPKMIETVLKYLAMIFNFVDLSSADLTNAAEMLWDDFEDAVQASTAARIHAHSIITRNIKDFQASSVAALTPTEFLARL